jgi:glutathione synthase/RimK-type ligase-like ATP-grasp enzyme
MASPVTRPIGIYFEHPGGSAHSSPNSIDAARPTNVSMHAAPLRRDQWRRTPVRTGLQPHGSVGLSARPRPRHLYTLNYLAHLEQLGVRVVNGIDAYRIETSKALQLSLLKSLGLPFPAARVINHRRGAGGS